MSSLQNATHKFQGERKEGKQLGDRTGEVIDLDRPDAELSAGQDLDDPDFWMTLGERQEIQRCC